MTPEGYEPAEAGVSDSETAAHDKSVQYFVSDLQNKQSRTSHATTRLAERDELASSGVASSLG